MPQIFSGVCNGKEVSELWRRRVQKKGKLDGLTRAALMEGDAMVLRFLSISRAAGLQERN